MNTDNAACIPWMKTPHGSGKAANACALPAFERVMAATGPIHYKDARESNKRMYY